MMWVWLAVTVLLLGGSVFLWRIYSDGELLAVGTPAPVFALPNQNGTVIDTSTLLGHWHVIYFYPKDDTPGCTKEACAFRDRLHELQAMDVRILGVSFDNVASHRAFAEKYRLTFDLLADPEGKVIRAYGATSPVPGFARRVSYLVDDTGIIRKAYPDVTPSSHAGEIIGDVRSLRERD